MSPRLLLAVAVGIGSLTLPVQTASACDPNRFPNCQTYCGAVASRYEYLRDLVVLSDGELPPWPRTGVAGCP